MTKNKMIFTLMLPLSFIVGFTVFPTNAQNTNSSTQQDVLPLIVGSEYTYKTKHLDRKNAVTSEEEVTIRLMSKTLKDGVLWYYFIKTNDEKQEDPTFSTIFLWFGPFRTIAGGMEGMTGLSWDIMTLGPQTFLKFPLKEGDETKFSIGKTFTLKVDGSESVSVPAGTFDNCVKLSFQSTGSRQVATFWLAHRVGLVKKLVSDEGWSVMYELQKFSIPTK